jgi:hypothetical protein
MNLILREPVLIAGLLDTIANALGAFGFGMTPAQLTALNGVFLALAVIVRAVVSPVQPPSSGSGTGKPLRISFPPKGSEPPQAARVAIASRYARIGRAAWFRRAYEGGSLTAVALILLAATGCAGSLESAKREGLAARRVGATAAAQVDPDYCPGVDSARAWGGFGAKTTGILGGGAGLGSIVVDDPQLRDGLAIGAVAAAAVSAGLIVFTENRDAAWARECASQ